MGFNLGEGEVEVLQQRLALDAAGWLMHADTNQRVMDGPASVIQFQELEPLGDIVVGWVDKAQGLSLLLGQDGRRFEVPECEHTYISGIRRLRNQQDDSIVQAVSPSGEYMFFLLDGNGRKVLPKANDPRFGGFFDGLTPFHADCYAIATKLNYSFLINRDGRVGSRFPVDVFVMAQSFLKREGEDHGAEKTEWQSYLAEQQARITREITKYSESITELERTMAAKILSDRELRPDVTSSVPSDMQRLLSVQKFILSMLKIDQRYLNTLHQDRIEVVGM